MPIPFLVIGGLAAAGLFGAGKAISAASDNSEAKDINDDAQKIIDRAKERLQKARRKTSSELEQLGRKKVEVWQDQLGHFLRSINKIQNVKLESISGLGGSLSLSKESLREMNVSYRGIINAFGGAAVGLAAGTGAAFASVGAVGALATAGTGTAISGLAGAAATNATLAWLGGGTLAAGGLGVAGGTAILGGVVAAPALLLFGMVASAKAKENLAKAKENRSMARETAAEADVMVAACKGVAERASYFWVALNEIAIRLDEALTGLDEGMRSLGTDYRKFTVPMKRQVAKVVNLAQVAWSLCDVPLLDKNGKLTSESAMKLEGAQRMIEG